MITICYFDVSDLNDENLYNNLSSTIPAERIEVMQKLKNKNDRLLSLGSFLMLGETLKRNGLALCDIEIYKTDKGKPLIKGDNLFFSLSHSCSIAICALSDKPVGVDVQIVKCIKNDVAKKYFTQSENDILNNSENKKDTFFRLWTAKEAYSKLTGDGIASFKDFSVRLGAKPCIEEDKSCNITEIEVDGYRICICAEANDEARLEKVDVCKI